MVPSRAWRRTHPTAGSHAPTLHWARSSGQGAAGTAWTLYRGAGNHLVPAARRAALSAATLAFVSAMFLFGLNWGLLWPVFLIFFGLEALASRGGAGAARQG